MLGVYSNDKKSLFVHQAKPAFRVDTWTSGYDRHRGPGLRVLHRNNSPVRCWAAGAAESTPSGNPLSIHARPASGGRAVVNGAADSNVRRLRPSGVHPCRKKCGVRLRRTDYFVPDRPGYHGARSVNAAQENEMGGVLRCASPPKDGVTVAARRDAPVGVGTRNVPQDSPTPPAGRTRNNGEASQQEAPAGARRPSEHVSNAAPAAPRAPCEAPQPPPTNPAWPPPRLAPSSSLRRNPGRKFYRRGYLDRRLRRRSIERHRARSNPQIRDAARKPAASGEL
jgi:hypothetical protein